MTVPVYSKNNGLYPEAAFEDPLWETCTPEEILDSSVVQSILVTYKQPGLPEAEYRNFVRGILIENIQFYRNATIKFRSPKIMKNTNGLKIPSANGEGFSLNPGIEVTWQNRTVQYFGPRGLFRTRWHDGDQIPGIEATFSWNNKEYDVAWSHNHLQVVTAASQSNIDRIHTEADPVCEKRRLESPVLLDEFIKKNQGDSKVAEQLSRLIYSNGWHDKDPEVLFSIFEFCRNNTAGIRDFSTWVRTHKSQIKLLNLYTVKQAIVLANVQTVNKA